MARNIKIFNQESNQSIIITSDATTWAELKSEINSDGRISANNKSAIVKETKVSLEFDDSVLPEGEFILFLFPVKVKSGAGSSVKKSISAKSSSAKSTVKAKAVKAAPVNNSMSYKEIEAMIKAKTKVINATIKDSTRTLKQAIEKEFSKISVDSAKQLAAEAKKLMREMGR